MKIKTALSCLLLNFVAITSWCADPEETTATLPATAPWNLKALMSPPEFEWIGDAGRSRALLYEGEPLAGKPTRTFAYYATPGTLAGDSTKDKDLPAVVLVHGGGGTAFRDWAELWAESGYAAIAMDLAGHRPIDGKNPHQQDSRERLPDGGPNQTDDEKFGSIDKPAGEQWPYHAVAAVLRAHSLVRSFPEVDAERTAVTGISWGGYLTCIVAGVDPRFKAAVPVYGCGYLHENSAWTDRLAKMTQEQRERWVLLWDPSRYLPSVSMPILFVNGTNDFAYPLDSFMKSFDVVPGRKQLCITVNMPHSHQAGWAPKEIGLFVDQHLRGGEPLPTVSDPQVRGDKIHMHYKSSARLGSAAIHVTTDKGAMDKRQWQSLPATITEGTIQAAPPGPETTAWFLSFTDDRDAVVSSRVFFGDSK